MFEKQSQRVDEGGAAVQAGRDAIVIQGITYELARQIALDVYQANFPALVAQAGELARARAEELTDKFFRQLHEENPDGLAQATTPAFQSALLNAQREHACAGDENLADLLVDLLVDRTKHQNRELRQLVLDEALKTAPKLTDAQIAVLAAAFLLKHVRAINPQWEGIVKHQEKLLAPVLEQAAVTPSTLSHLQFTGCGMVNTLVHADLTEILRQTYPMPLHEGFTVQELEQSGIDQPLQQFFFPLESGRRRLIFPSVQDVEIFREKGGLDVKSQEVVS